MDDSALSQLCIKCQSCPSAFSLSYAAFSSSNGCSSTEAVDVLSCEIA